jgi:lysophospholipase L1-like esterase
LGRFGCPGYGDGVRLATPALAVFAMVLAACGTDEGRDENRQGRDPQLTVVAALGDSITAGSPLWDPDPEVRATLGAAADPESQFEHWAERKLTGVRYRNCGVFGERTDQIATRLEGCAKGADVLIVQGGVNDIAQVRRVKTAARNLRSMVWHGKRLGLLVALCEVLPWNNGFPGAAQRIRRLNKLIRQIGRDEHVPVYPFHEALEDPRRPGRMRFEWTDDGDHPSVEGYRRLAEWIELPADR